MLRKLAVILGLTVLGWSIVALVVIVVIEWVR